MARGSLRFVARPQLRRRLSTTGARSTGGLMPSEMTRLKMLGEENAKWKRLVADLSLDKTMLQDVINRKPARHCA